MGWATQRIWSGFCLYRWQANVCENHEWNWNVNICFARQVWTLKFSVCAPKGTTHRLLHRLQYKLVEGPWNNGICGDNKLWNVFFWIFTFKRWRLRQHLSGQTHISELCVGQMWVQWMPLKRGKWALICFTLLCWPLHSPFPPKAV